MGNGHDLRVALCQVRPRKGAVKANVAMVRDALPADADLAVFPETVLSGYFVEGAAHEVALARGALVKALGAPPEGRTCDVALGFYERGRRGVYNSMAYLTPDGERYELLHVHRKVFLPTYGLFEEGRFVEPGRQVAGFDTRFGRLGMLICEDLWHSITASVLALDGAELILAGCASPARGFNPANSQPASAAPRPGAAASQPASAAARPANLDEWDRIAARAAREHGVFMMVAQLAGSEGGKLFPGGSSAWAPDGTLLARAPLFDDARTVVAVDFDEILRVRTESPFLADLSTALPRLRRSLDVAWTGDRPPTRPAAAGAEDGSARADRGAAARRRGAPNRPNDTDFALLEIDAALVEQALVEFIFDEVTRHRGFEKVVVGVSGGVDSAVSLFLAAKALGPENVHGFRLPYATSSPESLSHAALAIQACGARQRTVSITEAVDGYLETHEPDLSPLRRGNLAARLRSVVLFDQSAKLGALPLGTGNKSERLLGYYTWHADDSPPINPLGDLFKTQVWQLARHLGVPGEIVDKPASADLVRGVHDEDELGISYHRADPILHWLLKRHNVESLVGLGFDRAEVETVWRRLSSTHWKRELPTVALLSDSAIGESYLRPVDY